jgi:hypothetical protein
MADIMISPIYLILDDRDRSGQVTLLNTTNTTNVYRLEWSLYRQKEDGSYDVLDDVPAGQIDPRRFIRFSPRQITLLPQTRQMVRVQVQKPADLPEGEYRLHMTFKRLPNVDNVTEDPENKRGMSMELRVTLGVSMPVVVRHGPYDAKVSIVDAKFAPIDKSIEDPAVKSRLMVRVNRTGKHGTYGRLRVLWEKDGVTTQVGTLNNFSVFAESATRLAAIPMTVDQVDRGQLRVVYEGDGPQRGAVLASQTIQIGR